MDNLVVSVSEFVALTNQTLEFAYPSIRVEGEVSELRISKNRWVYFNLQDENSSVRMFGTVYHLQQPIEDGMKVVVKGSPRLHNKYGFSLNISAIAPSGEGSIKRAFELLKKKLTAEGLFAPERKRSIPAQPTRIGLITSGQAAAYLDFLKIVNERWVGLTVMHADVQVQGDAAPRQVANAINYFSQMSEPVDVVVITRGGGGAEDLMVFNTEEVARAVAGSRIPTIVGVGHEIDVSLADMAADLRATTPTNAAQLVVPDKKDVIDRIDFMINQISRSMTSDLDNRIATLSDRLISSMNEMIINSNLAIDQFSHTLELVNPQNVMRRGYSMVTDDTGKLITASKGLKKGDKLMIKFSKGTVLTEVVDAEKR